MSENKFIDWLLAYGWAIIIIIGAVWALFHFNVINFNPECAVPRDFFEREFNVTLQETGYNYKIKIIKGEERICISSEFLRKQLLAFI